MRRALRADISFSARVLSFNSSERAAFAARICCSASLGSVMSWHILDDTQEQIKRLLERRIARNEFQYLILAL